MDNELTNEIIAAGGFDLGLAGRLEKHEREQIVARGVSDESAAEIVKALLANTYTRRTAIAALKERDPDNFVADLRRVPLPHRGNPAKLRLAAMRERENLASAEKAVARAMQRRAGRSFSRWGEDEAPADDVAPKVTHHGRSGGHASALLGNW